MTPTHVPPEKVDVAAARLAPRPQAAIENEVMLDQLEFLIEHVQEGVCGCEQCERYLRARTLLLEVFSDAPRPAVAKKSSAAAGK